MKLKKLFLFIFFTLFLSACQTITTKIDKNTEQEKKELSKWLNKSESDLKICLIFNSSKEILYELRFFFYIHALKAVFATKAYYHIFRVYLKFSFTFNLIFLSYIDIVPISCF